MDKISRASGCFFGSIVGDALGGPVEFKSRESLNKTPVTDMNLFNNNFGNSLPPGSWTDDTSMMLCLAVSLINGNGVLDPLDTLLRYQDWYENGYMSVNGECFDIGNTTRKSIENFKGYNLESITDDMCGNGSIMRLNPIPIYCVLNNMSIQDCISMAGKSSKTTHNNKLCIDSCRLLSCILYNLLDGVHKDNLITKWQKDIEKKSTDHRLNNIYNGKFLQMSRDQISSSGYSVDTLEAALYSFYKFDNYQDSVLHAVNLGSDSDTVACVTGMICGAYYGIKGVPEKWISNLKKSNLLVETLNKLKIK
jgi:ADP-ribosyl-[dinitrogen reductase] hydrolase